MKRQQRVVWSKGMFLMPQHFQAQERFFEEEFGSRSLFSRYMAWGIAEIELDESAIANGTVCSIKCTGLFEDGTAFDLPGADPLPPSRDFTSLFDPGKRDLEVFLSVPERRFGERNIAHENGATLRYLASDQPFIDEYDGEEEPILVASTNYRITFSGESKAGLNALAIARIVRGDGGVYRLDEQYIPPALNAACNRYLWENVLRSLLNKMVFITGERTRERSQQSELLADFSTSDIKRFWMLDLLNRALPELKHILSIEHVHPEDLYRFLVRLAGGLCTYSTEYRPTEFPAYDHRNLNESLIGLCGSINRMLESIAYRKRNCNPFTLTEIEPSRHWKGKLDSVRVTEGQLYLAIRGRRSEIDVHQVEEQVKVCGPKTVVEARDRRLVGLTLRQEFQAPSDCPRRASAYFRVVPGAELTGRRTRLAARPSGTTTEQEEWRAEIWEDIGRNNEVHVLIQDELPDAEIELFLVSQ